MMKVICEQYRDGVKDDAPPIVIPKLKNESVSKTLERKMNGADLHGWDIERMNDNEFHAWKEYSDGDGTPDRPNRKDRYFRIVD